MKICFKCGAEKPNNAEFFYRHPQMSDGFLGKCKECTKKDVAQRAAIKREEILEYDKRRNILPHRVAARKAYNNSPAGKASHSKALKKQIRNYPEKRKARVATGNAIRDGRLKRYPCQVCGNVKSESHHEDYSKPLEVRWLCNKHHREEHKKCQ